MNNEYIDGLVLGCHVAKGRSRNLCVLLVFFFQKSWSLFLSFCQHIISQPLDSSRFFSLKKIYICVLCTLLLLSSPLVSIATWRGMKDWLLARKFLPALMERLQEVNSSSCRRLERMLKSNHATLVCLHMLRCWIFIFAQEKWKLLRWVMWVEAFGLSELIGEVFDVVIVLFNRGGGGTRVVLTQAGVG